MAGTEGNEEMNVLKGLVNSLAQSVQTLTARQSAPTDQLKKSVELNSELEYQQRCIKRERDCDSKKQGIVRQQNLLGANTDAIIASQGATETSYAAGLARAYSGGGYDDWFLPSKDELNQMYLNKATINTTASANGGSNFSTSSSYWSSTENDTDRAWIQGFFGGSANSRNKSNTFLVRAVRAF